MKVKWVLIMLVFVGVVMLSATLLAVFEGRKVGGWADAKVVKEITSGFIPLPLEGDNWSFMPWGTQIKFLDINGKRYGNY